MKEIVVDRIVWVVSIQVVRKIEFRSAIPRIQRPTTIGVIGRLDNGCIGRSRWRAIARTIAICRVGFYAIHEDVIEHILRIFNEFTDDKVGLVAFKRVEGIPETQTRNGSIDDDYWFLTGEFFIQFYRIAIEIVYGKVEDGISNVVAA